MTLEPLLVSPVLYRADVSSNTSSELIPNVYPLGRQGGALQPGEAPARGGHLLQAALHQAQGEARQVPTPSLALSIRARRLGVSGGEMTGLHRGARMLTWE